MHDLVSQGKAIYWGTSQWSAAEIMAAWQIADKHHLHKPVMEQPQYNMFDRAKVEHEYTRLYEDIGMGTDLSTVMDDAEVNLQGLQAMTLEEARVSELLLGRHVAQAAFGQAYATGGISESRYVDEIKGLQSKYSQALSGALEKLAAKEGL